MDVRGRGVVLNAFQQKKCILIVCTSTAGLTLVTSKRGCLTHFMCLNNLSRYLHGYFFLMNNTRKPFQVHALIYLRVHINLIDILPNTRTKTTRLCQANCYNNAMCRSETHIGFEAGVVVCAVFTRTLCNN